MILRPHFLPLALALTMTLVTLGGSDLSLLWRFEREPLLAGEFWRLITGHLVHLGWSHTGLNIAGLALVWLLVGASLNVKNWLITITGSALGISAGLLVFNPELSWYVGLSGVLHGMLITGCVVEIRHTGLRNNEGLGNKAVLVLLILVWAKLIWEQLAGPLPGSEASAGGTVIVDAHFYGGLCGIVFGSLLKPLSRQPDQD